jgi:hypothetical protein
MEPTETRWPAMIEHEQTETHVLILPPIWLQG